MATPIRIARRGLLAAAATVPLASPEELARRLAPQDEGSPPPARPEARGEASCTCADPVVLAQQLAAAQLLALEAQSLSWPAPPSATIPVPWSRDLVVYVDSGPPHELPGRQAAMRQTLKGAHVAARCQSPCGRVLVAVARVDRGQRPIAVG